MNDAILSKLKKLLNLSKSASGAEAELALSKATEIATNAGIDLAMVAAKDTNTEQEKLELVEDEIKCGSRLPSLQKYASWLLQAYFNVKIIYTGSRCYGKNILFLGDKKDVEFAKFVNNFVQEDMQRRWEYYKKGNNLSVRFKQTFMYNCWRGFDAKLKEAKQATENQRFNELPVSERSTVESKYALVISTKADAVKSFMVNRHPRLRNVAVRVGNVFSGTSVAKDGFAVGQTMNVNRPLPC